MLSIAGWNIDSSREALTTTPIWMDGLFRRGRMCCRGRRTAKLCRKRMVPTAERI